MYVSSSTRVETPQLLNTVLVCLCLGSCTVSQEPQTYLSCGERIGDVAVVVQGHPSVSFYPRRPDVFARRTGGGGMLSSARTHFIGLTSHGYGIFVPLIVARSCKYSVTPLFLVETA